MDNKKLISVLKDITQEISNTNFWLHRQGVLPTEVRNAKIDIINDIFSQINELEQNQK